MSTDHIGQQEILGSLRKVMPLPIDLNDELLRGNGDDGNVSPETLIKQGHDLLAAHVVGLQIRECTDINRILQLWLSRICCLLVAQMENVVKEESKALGHLNSEHFRLDDGTCFAPWDLRLILVPFQQSSSQACLGKWYVLAREARTEASKARRDPDSDESVKLWNSRLRQLGLYVAATLLALKDYYTAIDHLKSMHATCIAKNPPSSEDSEFAKSVANILALVHLQIGDTISAREWFSRSGDDNSSSTLNKSISALADADWQAAVSHLSGSTSPSPSASNSLSIAEVHQGNLENGINILEELAKSIPETTSPTNRLILNNLFTLYDLNESTSAQNRAKWRRLPAK